MILFNRTNKQNIFYILFCFTYERSDGHLTNEHFKEVRLNNRVEIFFFYKLKNLFCKRFYLKKFFMFFNLELEEQNFIEIFIFTRCRAHMTTFSFTDSKSLNKYIQ
jgi:hypothetical protein